MATPSKMPGNASNSATMKEVDELWRFLGTELAAVTTFLMENNEDRASNGLKSARHYLDGKMIKLKAAIAEAAEDAADSYKKLALEKSKVCKAQAKVRELEVKVQMLEEEKEKTEHKDIEEMQKKINKLEAELDHKNLSLTQIMQLDEQEENEEDKPADSDVTGEVEIIAETQQ